MTGEEADHPPQSLTDGGKKSCRRNMNCPVSPGKSLAWQGLDAVIHSEMSALAAPAHHTSDGPEAPQQDGAGLGGPCGSSADAGPQKPGSEGGRCFHRCIRPFGSLFLALEL